MNILFLTIGRFESIESHSIYPDLLRQFRNHKHNVYVISAQEKRNGIPTSCINDKGATILRVCIGNITKCGMLEKGISTLKIEDQYKNAIKKYFPDVKFDLVLYSTPPITLCGVVEYIKKRDNAKTYLLLKDIFPQNAVDLGLLKRNGIKSVVYRYFRNKEKKLYSISDYIGCMSQANVDYVLKHNPEIGKNRVEVCPNCIEPRVLSISSAERLSIREKLGIPSEKLVFVYGGNLGKPQGIPFILECIRSQRENSKIFFLIVGDGTEYNKIAEFIECEKQENVRLLQRLPKEDYDRMVVACDVGMLFLDHRFTIPNFPSRLLIYMQAGIPVLACTDSNTDVGKVIVDGEVGWWCESNDVKTFSELISDIVKQDLKKMSPKIKHYLDTNFNAKNVYQNMMKHFGEE